MPNTRTKKPWPNFKDQWREDARGFWLGILSLISFAAIIALTLPRIINFSEYLWSFVIGGILIIGNYWLLIKFRNWLLKFDRISEEGANYFVFYGSFVIFIAFAVTAIVTGTGTGVIAIAAGSASASILVIASVFTVAGTSAGRGIGYTTGTFVCGIWIAVGVATVSLFAFSEVTFIGAFAFLVVFFGVGSGGVYIFLIYLLSLNRSIALFQEELESKEIIAQAQLSKSVSDLRQQIKVLIQKLITNKKWLTLGLAGRRGIGKTVTAETIRWWFKNHAQEKIRYKHQLKEDITLKNARLKRVEIFIKTPTAFDEKSFLMSVFESLARKVDFLLSRILPPIKPIQEQRILEKIDYFRNRIHLIQILLLSLVILWLTFWGFQKAGFWLSLKKGKSGTASLQQQTPVPSDSLLEKWNWPEKDFFIKERKGLKESTETDLKAIKNRLAYVDSVLSLELKNPTFWELFKNFKEKISLDSAKRALGSEIKVLKIRIDSLENKFRFSLIKLDTLRFLFNDYNQLQERIKKLQHILEARTELLTNWTLLAFLSPPLLIFISMLIILGVTKPDRMNTSHYDRVRYEILLYQSTRDLLDRLHYNMTFSESENTSMNISVSQQGFGLGFGRTRKKKLTRAMQPFTLQSLVDEYKRYVYDVRIYISKALAESDFDEKEQESFSKILICIDELDKVLDPDRLHNMLKSLKSIFELDGVYYILSISEDALESYELRGLQTKNEIDSTFTHVFKLPPMEVNQCREFYKQKKIKDNLAPLAIVNGGGVPRDMERIADLIQLNYSNQRMSPENYREYYENLERKGLIDKIRNHPRLAPIQKKELEDRLHQIMDSKISIDQVATLIQEKRFLECYPCSAEEGKKDYCNLIGLLQAFSVKAEINQLISEWMKFYDSLGMRQWWAKYKERVDRLRQAVYLLGESPFAAKEELDKAKEMQI